MNDFMKRLFEKVGDGVVSSLGDVPDQKSIRMLGVMRDSIERGHIETYLREFSRLDKKKTARSSVMLVFDGYDTDLREVYQVPEVRTWVSRLIKNVPHLFYFLTPDNFNMRIVFLCLVKVGDVGGGRVDIHYDGSTKLLIERLVSSAVAHSRKRKDPLEVQFSIANTIMEQTGYDNII